MSQPYKFKLAVLCFAFAMFASDVATGDIVLTFDQTGITDSIPINQDYGDRVTATSDGIGSYGVVAGSGDLFTPNVEVSYTANSPDLWTTGYSDLTNVLYDEVDFGDGFEVSFFADSGFEVGIHEFDLGAFGGDETIPGVQILDGLGNVLWTSGGSTFLDGTTATNFDTGGVFAQTLVISVDVTGLGGASDNIGIDNIRFSQRVSSVPEPTSATLLLLAGICGVLRRRK